MTTVLIAIGLLVAFLIFPVETVLASIGTAIAGLPGAVVGVIIGFIIHFARQ